MSSDPDLDAVLEREHARRAKQGSGVQATRSAGRLADVARRRKQGKGVR